MSFIPPRLGPTLAGAAALVALLCALFLPWHDIISGDEQIAPERIPQTRQSVAAAAAAFDQANAGYQDYIKSHGLGALHDRILGAIATAEKATGEPPQDELQTVTQLGSQVDSYALVLHDYSQASDAYLEALRSYDDDLMSWTRGLFGASESLRSQTWPFVEHLKLYPEPVGLKTDPPQVSAAQVEEQMASLKGHLAALDASSSQARLQALEGINSDVAAIWESGRSVEYIAGLHTEYRDELAAYDAKVVQAAQDPQAATPAVTSPVFSWGLTVIITALTLAGLTALFLPRFRTETVS
jgi:hypothetical protein